PDARRVYHSSGQIVESFEDNDFDGKWDVRLQYRDGVVAVAERDLDFDGSYDSHTVYHDGVPLEETITPGGAGNTLYRDEFERGVRIVRWSDPERDGKWNERIEFDAMGRETARLPMK
ncbi:MAG TPA: hypothetical protein VIM57_05420, partial [Luteolibacter sp.]